MRDNRNRTKRLAVFVLFYRRKIGLIMLTERAVVSLTIRTSIRIVNERDEMNEEEKESATLSLATSETNLAGLSDLFGVALALCAGAGAERFEAKATVWIRGEEPVFYHRLHERACQIESLIGRKELSVHVTRKSRKEYAR